MYRYATFALLGALPLAAAPVQVGRYSAKIVPERVSVLTIPDAGIVSDLASAEGRLEAGTVIAILDKERTAENREDMELQIARERITKRDEIQKLRNQRRKVEFYNSLSTDERRFNSDFKGDDQPGSNTLQDIDERISLLERELKTVERRKRKEFDEKHDKLTLRMPFRGRLQYNITLPEDTSKPFEYTGLTPEEGYQIFAIGIDEKTGEFNTEVYFSEVINTPAKKVSESYIEINVDKYFDGFDLASAYPNDFSDADGWAIVPLEVKIHGDVVDYYYDIYVGDVAADPEATDNALILDLVQYGNHNTALTMSYCYFYEDLTLVYFSKDTDDNYSEVKKVKINLDPAKCAPVTEFTYGSSTAAMAKSPRKLTE